MATNPYKKYYTLSYRDFYKDYSKRCKKDKVYPIRSIHEYRDFINDVFHEIFEKMLTSKFHLTLPHRLGDLFLKKTKLTGMAAKLYRNAGTLGKTFKFHWDRTYADFESKPFYKCIIQNKYKKRLRAFYRQVNNGEEKIPNPYNFPLKEQIDFD